jgi:3-deoxy-D-arabino-heptulosonate 7-phosphate (DAHP) synthase class II
LYFTLVMVITAITVIATMEIEKLKDRLDNVSDRTNKWGSQLNWTQDQMHLHTEIQRLLAKEMGYEINYVSGHFILAKSKERKHNNDKA